MRLTVAAAAFDGRAQDAYLKAKAACETAAKQQAELLLLPGTGWSRGDVVKLSKGQPSLMVCAGIEGEYGGIIAKDGGIVHSQPSLYGRVQGDELLVYEEAGLPIAILAGPDAFAPPAARMAAMLNTCLLLCPVERIYDAGPWAQINQNSLYAAEAPNSGEARILCPLCAQHPQGIMARGRPGSMAIVRIEAADWIRSRMSYDPLSLLNKSFAASMPQQPAPAEPPPPPLRVAAVQRTIDMVGGEKGLIERMEALCSQAKEEGCGLIAFPEMNWIEALGKYTGKKSAEDLPTSIALDDEDEGALQAFFPNVPNPQSPGILMHTLIRLTAGSIARLAVRETRRLAQKYGMVVHGGTFWEKKKKKLYNTAVIAEPEGGVLLQRKLCLTAQERMMGLSMGEELTVFPIGQGASACAPICMDATYYEPFYAARRSGCDLCILPIFNGEPYYAPAARRGAFGRAREAGLYILKPALTGNLLGTLYTGHAGVYSPMGDVETKSPLGDELLVHTLDFEKLYQVRGPHPYNGALETALAAKMQKQRE